MAVPAIRRIDAAYRQRQRDKVSRIANSLGSIGELFLKKAEREREIKQQELENQIKLRQIALQEAQGKVSQQNADTAASNLSQRIEEHNLAVRKYNDQRGDSSAEAIEVEKTRAGLYQAVETIKGTLSEEDKVKLDGLLATNSSVEESIIRQSLGLPKSPTSGSSGTEAERDYAKALGMITTPNLKDSLLSQTFSDKDEPLLNTIMKQAMKDEDLGTEGFRGRLIQLVHENLGESSKLGDYGESKNILFATEVGNYLWNNIENALPTDISPSRTAEEDFYNRSTVAPKSSPPPEEDPLVRLERMLSQ